MPCQLPVFDRQEAGALFEELGKPAGDRAADHLGDLAHGAAEAPLEAGFSSALDFLCLYDESKLMFSNQIVSKTRWKVNLSAAKENITANRSSVKTVNG